jgi:hypothetical protein
MNTNLIPKRDPSCDEEVLEGEIVLYCSTVAKAVYLNPSAALVWRLIDGRRSVGEIEALLTGAYPEVATLREELIETVQALQEQGVIHF